MNEVWVLEYSRKAQDKEHFPWHITTRTASDKSGPGPLDWQVVFTGTNDEVYAEFARRTGETYA